MSFLPFVRRWFGAKSAAIQSQPGKPDPDTELVDRAEVLIEDLNDVEENVAVSFDSLPGAFLSKGGTRTDENIDLLTGGGDADSLHTHSNIPPLLSNAPPPAVAAASSSGSSVDAARADHTHASPPNPALATAAPPGVGAASIVGTSARAAREDHSHASPPLPDLASSAPPAVAAASSIGTSPRIAREDHTHAAPALSDSPPPAVAGASSPGTSTESARGDHTHASPPNPALATAAPPAVAAVSSIGISASAARQDHTHASPPIPPLSNATPPAVAVASSAGTASESARADHTHASPPNPALATASPPAVAVTSSVGTSARAAREDHTHASPGAIVMWGNSGWGTGTNTKYADPYWTGAAAGTVALQIRAPRSGTLRHLMLLARLSGAGTFTARVRINDVATALVVTLGSGATQTENLTDSIAVNQGDRIDLEVARTVAGSPTDITITAELV